MYLLPQVLNPNLLDCIQGYLPLSHNGVLVRLQIDHVLSTLFFNCLQIYLYENNNLILTLARCRATIEACMCIS